MIVEVHSHPFGPPSQKNIGDKIKSVSDLIGFRSRYPELYNTRLTEPLVDYADEFLSEMDKYGIEKALIMSTGSADSEETRNQKIAAVIEKHPDRFGGLMTLGTDYTNEGFGDNPEALRQNASDRIDHYIGKLGFKGIGETHGGPFTTEVHPVKIAEQLRPIMESLTRHNVPLLLATGWTQFPGRMYYNDPIYVDEIAGRFPNVPIVLTKMGRGIDHYFESALIVALRNPNVYFDTTSTTAQHIRRAVKTIGAQRIMFGTDWSPTWKWVREPEPLYTTRFKVIQESGISEAEAEWVLGKTAVELYKL